ncbi:MAG: SnoaL-like domain-containing protein [Planctomycetota bacterium]
MSIDMASVLEIGNRMVGYCRKGEHETAIRELYADDARHVEAMEMGGMPRVTEGKSALLDMLREWEAMHECHDGDLKGPYPHGENRFAVWMSVDLTPHQGPMAGQRHVMEEVCLYTVENGRITLAEFFWDPTGYGA